MRNNNGIKLWLIVVAALVALVVIGTGSRPARAANVEKDVYTGPVILNKDIQAFKICEDSGTPGAICVMKYAATEVQALNHAKTVLDFCVESERDGWTSDCPSSRAYIRQRWGY
jgi:hypothetical protein